MDSKSGEVKKSSAERAAIDRARQIAYNHSEQGKLARARYLERNADRVRAYIRDYFRARRAKAKSLGVCGNCMKRERSGRSILCEPCLERLRVNSAKLRVARGCKVRGSRKPVGAINRSGAKESDASFVWKYFKDNNCKIAIGRRSLK